MNASTQANRTRPDGHNITLWLQLWLGLMQLLLSASEVITVPLLVFQVPSRRLRWRIQGSVEIDKM